MNSWTAPLAAPATLIADLTHEIRNPLQAIKLNLHTMQRFQQHRRELTPSDLRSMLDQSLSEIDYLDMLLQRVVELVSPAQPRTRTVNIVEEVRSLADTVTSSGERRGVELVMQCSGDVASAQVDADRLRRVLLELLHNAEDAVGEGGRIRLHVQCQVDHVEIAVDDDGPGLGDDQVAHIFEPFITNKPQHPGLGLAFVARYVDEWRGDIQVQSNVWGGATFLVRIPLPCDGNGEPTA